MFATKEPFQVQNVWPSRRAPGGLLPDAVLLRASSNWVVRVRFAVLLCSRTVPRAERA
ncbi:hypothetical protein DUI70_5214 [Streptomyces albus]|nr:hypothetical protein DUI70_5214 [Streptomyces albus]